MLNDFNCLSFPRKDIKKVLIVIRLTIIILILSVFQLVATSSYSQVTTFSVKETGIELIQLFTKIENQSEFLFFYLDADVKNIRVNVDAENENIEKILEKALNGTDLTFIIHNRNVNIIRKNRLQSLQQSNNRITGLVVDEKGEPIIGANVVEKGTTNGVVTNYDGNFSIQVSENTILQISYIGYLTQEIETKNQNSLLIVLHEDIQTIDEVVVVGYGIQKKTNLTGAVASVKMDEVLGNRPVISLASALQGSVPGLQVISTTGIPGQSMNLNIRGTTSINGGSPLILLNNSPIEDINLIDPQEIESISVLKDASSSAIYGARAAFGVILITTKQGEKNRKPSFNYNNNIAFTTPASLPQKASPIEAVRAYKKMGWPNNTHVDGTNLNDWETYLTDYANNPSKYPLGYFYDEGGNLFLLAERDQFQDMMSESGFQQKHNLSITGGTEKTNYRIAFGYTNEDGILITNKDSYKRLNTNAFWGIEVTDWIMMQLDMSFANSDKSLVEDGGRNGVWGRAASSPSYTNNQEIEINGVSYLPESSATYIRKGKPRLVENKNLRTTGRVILTPLKRLRITGEYTYNRLNVQKKNYLNKYQYVGLNLAQIINNVENSSYEITQQYTDYNSINLFADYTIDINDHDLSLMVGFNQEFSNFASQYSNRMDVLIPELPSLSLSTGTLISNDSFSQFAIRGLFYRVNYSYAGKYLLEANGRYDGSSRFPKENRFGFFPSFSAGWRISEEAFMESTTDILSNLKIRASWGQIGNQAVGDNYAYIPGMTPYLSNWLVDGQKVTTLSLPAMVSANFTWERVETLDIGVDLGFINNRLSGIFDLYRRDTKGMLAPGMEFPLVVGSAAPKENVADLKSYGWELKLNWMDRIGDWNYRLGFNIYDYQAEITKFDNEAGLISNHYVGKKMGEIWGFETDRFYTEDDFNTDGSLKEGIPKFHGAGQVYPGDVLYKDLNKDGIIYTGENTINDPGDRKIIGNSTPRYQYGITSGIGWKGFDLSIFLQGIGKRDYWRTDQLAWPDAGWGTLYKETLNFWSEENTNAFYPRIYVNETVNTTFNKRNQTKYLADASYLRLQNVTLSYSFPNKTSQKLFLNSLKLFVSGENLYTWHHLSKGMDPAMVTENSWKYPFMKKISFGFNISF